MTPAEYEARIAKLETFLQRVKESMDWYSPDDVFLLIDGGVVTIQQAITAILDRPEARGETPLLEVE